MLPALLSSFVATLTRAAARLCSRQIALVALLAWQSVALAAEAEKYNVLFIIVDDLRPELGCYGTPLIQSPNIDALAKAGTVFNRAYCQQAICGPSRTSFLTGLRPDATRIYDMQTHFRLHRPEVVTLPQYFKEHGYRTQSLGKVFHDLLDDPRSWSVPSWAPQDRLYGKPETQAAVALKREKLEAEHKLLQVDSLQRDPETNTVLKIKHKGTERAIGPAWEDPDVPDNELRDGKLADKAIAVLGEMRDKPFFLAIGFYRPHLPFVAPKKYFDLYQRQNLPLARNPTPPTDVPKIALTNSEELRTYSDIPKLGPVSNEQAQELIHAYDAAVSYVDAQVGRVLLELNRLGLRERTVVVLCGDHGWHLGEQGLWGKQTNFEVAARTPLIISAPRQAGPGAKTDALVELVDIYPTLAELCGLPKPAGLDGTSLAPVLNAPGQPFKKTAFTQYPRGPFMGRSMRTDRYRYTEWAKPGSSVVGVELYDHQNDPDEHVNIAHQPGQQELAESFGRQLHSDWPTSTSPTNLPEANSPSK
jgi:arylsulfatase A-like enzyme